jgi:hypothetical protein
LDQAANLYEVLAWSFLLKSVLRTANIYDVSHGINHFFEDEVKFFGEKIWLFG